jgi:phenylacetate-CoA ligase
MKIPSQKEPVGFQRLLPPHQARVRDIYRQLRAFEVLPQSGQEAIQAAELSRLLRHAHAHSAFWRERINDAGINPDGAVGPKDLARLPILTRADLQERRDVLRARSPQMRAEEIVTNSTSGSTGRPVQTDVFTPTYVPTYQALELVDHYWHQRDARLTLGSYTRRAPNVDNGAWGPPIQWFEPVARAFAREILGKPAEDFYRLIELHRPAYVLTSPSVVRAFVEMAGQSRRPVPRVRQFITSTEAVDRELRDAARRAFGAVITDRYSCEEVGWIALQCPRRPHYHALGATVIVEIVDDAGRPCAPGETGRVLLTALHSYAMPLIRYEVGDLAAWGPPCDCGIRLPVIREIAGRLRDVVVLPDGTRRNLVLNIGRVCPDASILEHQALLYSCGTIEIRVRAARPLGPSDISRIRDRVQLGYGPAARVIVTETREVRWTGLYKRQEVLRLDRPYVEGETATLRVASASN